MADKRSNGTARVHQRDNAATKRFSRAEVAAHLKHFGEIAKAIQCDKKAMEFWRHWTSHRGPLRSTSLLAQVYEVVVGGTGDAETAVKLAKQGKRNLSMSKLEAIACCLFKLSPASFEVRDEHGVWVGPFAYALITVCTNGGSLPDMQHHLQHRVWLQKEERACLADVAAFCRSIARARRAALVLSLVEGRQVTANAFDKALTAAESAATAMLNTEAVRPFQPRWHPMFMLGDDFASLIEEIERDGHEAPDDIEPPEAPSASSLRSKR